MRFSIAAGVLGTALALCAATTVPGCGIGDVENADPGDGASSGGGGDPGAGGGTGSGAVSTGSVGSSAVGPGAGGAGGGGVGGQGGGLPAPGVACGGETCDPLSTVCCVRASGYACEAPADCEVDGRDPVKAKLSCDDALDCDGSVCCLDLEPASGLQLYTCKAAGTCGELEACGPDKSCGPPLTCVADDASLTKGKCVTTGADVPCGPINCIAAAPVCCWADASTTGECTTHVAACDFPVECDAPDDCAPPAVCCATGAGASCKASCDGASLCATDADCDAAILRPGPGAGPPDRRQGVPVARSATRRAAISAKPAPISAPAT